jgi:hypothetical protein
MVQPFPFATVWTAAFEHFMSVCFTFHDPADLILNFLNGTASIFNGYGLYQLMVQTFEIIIL